MTDPRILSDIFASNHHLENLVFILGVVGIACFSGIATTWIKYRARRLASSDLTAHLAQLADRMAKLDNAVDTIAIEVERISEGQRYLTKVLAARDASPALVEAVRPGRSTQHQ